MTSTKITQSVFRFILYFVCKMPYAFLLQGFLCLAWSIKETFFPFFLKLTLDNIYHKQVLGWQIFYPFLGVAIIWIVMEIAMRIQGYFSVNTFPILRANIREYGFEAIKSQSYVWLSKHNKSALQDSITQLPSACQNIVEIIILHFVSIFGALIISFIMLAAVNQIFCYLMVLWLLLHFLSSYFFNKKITESGMNHAHSSSGLAGSVGDVLANILSVKLFRREAYEHNRFLSLQNNEIRLSAKATRVIESMRIYQSMFAILYMLTSLFALIYLWNKKIILIGDLTLVPMLAFSTLGMIWWLTQQLNEFYRSLNTIRKALSILRQCEFDSGNISRTNPSLNSYDIELNQVGFNYDGKTIFSNLNLSISNSEKIGVLGLSGSGKSTLLHILSRILNPQIGSIKIGGTPLNHFCDEQLAQIITVVPQEPILFHRSIFENIRYGNIKADDAAIYQAAEQALCAGFIEQLPEKYQTIVGDSGNRLSIGQRQRVLIARALLAKTPIIILDEPTSSLDALTEKNLLDLLSTALKHCTIILITHRLSILPLVDRIVTFKDRDIIEYEA